MAERDWSEISIVDLTRRARVSRPTFYLHYSSLDELAADALIERLRESAGSAGDTTVAEESVPEWLVGFLGEVNANRVVYRRLVGARSIAGIAREMVAAKLVERIVQSQAAAPDAEEFAQFLAGGILGFLAYWLRSDETATAEAVSSAAQRLWAMIRGMFV
ncbi:TetR/AcrR family transcriptional regulator [Nocardia sp. CA-120079]|uniref:TetR/AcrR family transcriptional regulator n=1 Tax=Nocardia sp. CA-120079 TaxID=3239974 RepID=UPI003D9955B3